MGQGHSSLSQSRMSDHNIVIAVSQPRYKDDLVDHDDILLDVVIAGSQPSPRDWFQLLATSAVVVCSKIVKVQLRNLIVVGQPDKINSGFSILVSPQQPMSPSVHQQHKNSCAKYICVCKNIRLRVQVISGNI